MNVGWKNMLWSKSDAALSNVDSLSIGYSKKLLDSGEPSSCNGEIVVEDK